MTTRLRSLFFFLLALSSCARATSISGTVKWQGTPLTGYIDIALVYPSTNGSALILPGSNPNGHIPVYNGQIPAMDVDGNDTLLPRGTYYQIAYYNQYGGMLARLNYKITGATFDIGTAVPTPITPANINFLDLLGLRNLGAQNLTLTNQLQFSTGAIFSKSGVANAQLLNDIRFAPAFATGSTTCGIQEALTSLPSTGGTIWLQIGLCTASSPITVTKPVLLRGHGLPSTVLANGSTSATLFTITGPLSGATFQDFTIQGNLGVSGASTGDCILLNGTPGAVSNVTLNNLRVAGCKSHGLHLIDAVAGVFIFNSTLTGSGGSGLYLETPNSGTISGVYSDLSLFTSNGVDGVTIQGAGVSTVDLRDSRFLSNIANGVHLLSSSATATLHISYSIFTDNHASGVLLDAGLGSTIEQSTFLPGTHQLYGVNANLPTVADAFTTQLTLKSNLLQGNLTADLLESATTSYLLMYPQQERVGGTGVVYTLNNPAAVYYIPVQTSAGPITGVLTIASPVSPLASNTCTSYPVTMTSSVPSGAVVNMSVAQGFSLTGSTNGIRYFIQSISGSTVDVAFCNDWNTNIGFGPTQINLRVQQQ